MRHDCTRFDENQPELGFTIQSPRTSEEGAEPNPRDYFQPRSPGQRRLRPAVQKRMTFKDPDFPASTSRAPALAAPDTLTRFRLWFVETMKLSARLIRRIRGDGLLNTVKTLLWLLRPVVWNLYRLESLTAPPCSPGLEVRHGLVALRRLRKGHALLPDEFYHDGRTGFRECFTATLDGELAGIIWVREGRQGSRWLELGERQVEIGCLLVLPTKRNRGVARQLYWHAAANSLRAGAKDILAVIAADNVPSKRAAEAVGFRSVASIRRPALWGPRFSVCQQDLDAQNLKHS